MSVGNAVFAHATYFGPLLFITMNFVFSFSTLTLRGFYNYGSFFTTPLAFVSVQDETLGLKAVSPLILF